jgi:glycosyltransferase involved in cell wall biosynthesis
MDYCSHLVSYAGLSDRHLVLATTSDAIRSTEYQLRFPGGLSDIYDAGPLPDITNQRLYFSWLRRKISDVRTEYPDYDLIMLEGDKYLPYALIDGWTHSYQIPSHILVMRMPELSFRWRDTARGVGKAVIAKLLERRGLRIVALSPAATLAHKYTYRGFPATPDPVDLNTDVQLIREYRVEHLLPERLWFGVFGNITSRKNLDLIARALADSRWSDQYGLLVAGQLSQEEYSRCEAALALMQQSGVQLILKTGLLSATELDTAIGAVQAVVVAHSTDGPSGIVGKAFALNTFVVAAGAPVLEAELARFPDAGLFVSLDRQSLLEGVDHVRDSLSNTRPAKRFADRNEFSRALLQT